MIIFMRAMRDEGSGKQVRPQVLRRIWVAWASGHQICSDSHETCRLRLADLFEKTNFVAFDNIQYLNLFRTLCISNLDFTKESLLNPCIWQIQWFSKDSLVKSRPNIHNVRNNIEIINIIMITKCIIRKTPKTMFVPNINSIRALQEIHCTLNQET